MFWFGRKKKDKPDVKSVIPELKKKDLSTLIKELKSSQWILGWVPYEDRDEFKFLADEIKELEQQIIETLPDKFQKEVFKILAKEGFNFLEFLKEDDWLEPLRSIFKTISFWLGREHIVQGKQWEAPFSGKELCFWLLQETKKEVSNKYVESFVETFKKSLKDGLICGHQLNKEEVKAIHSSVIVLFSKEFAKQFRALVEIIHLQGGEEFIKNEIYDKVGI